MYKKSNEERGDYCAQNRRQDYLDLPASANHERDYTPDEWEFLKAMDRYKRHKRRPFPTWHEVMQVFLSLGYRKVAPPCSLLDGSKH